MKPFKSKTWDMRYHWLEDRISKTHATNTETRNI